MPLPPEQILYYPPDNTMTAQQIQHLTLLLPAKALEEMRQMAKDRRKEIPSPRGAAEFNFHDDAAAEGAGGSNDDVTVSVRIYFCAIILHKYHK